ncbi:MAG TPA: hypothetical protein VLA78_05005 [Paracoccaceae bacterium]|nr:hypothetical protein [Paracoccaceae bacterium]
MSGVVESMVSQFVFVETPEIDFASLVEELGEALDRSGAGERVTLWDCEDLALMDIGGLRFALAWCRHPLDDKAACMTLSVGPAPGDARPVPGLHPEEMCQLLARRLESVLLPDMTFWHRVDGPVDAEVIDRLIDSLPDVGVMRSIGAFRAKPRPHAAVQADAADDADVQAMLARVTAPENLAPPPEEPRATANSTVADPPADVVDLSARRGDDAATRRSSRRTNRTATVSVTAAATAMVLDLDPEPRIAASADAAPAPALHVVPPAADPDEDLPQPLADTADPGHVAGIDPYAILASEDEEPQADIAAPQAPLPVQRPARDRSTRTPRPDPLTALAERSAVLADMPAPRAAPDTTPGGGSVQELARLRSALYPPEDDTRAAEQPSPQLRLAAHAMDATLIVVAPPVGAALMTYGLLRGSNLVRSGRAMAVTCTFVGLVQGPLLALI